LTTHSSYDVLVIGAGHNGLACAAFLARAGRRVRVVEAAEEPGGAVRNAEIAPGYTAPACAHILHLLHPEVRRLLRLDKHGLRLAARGLPTVALGPDGSHVSLSGPAVAGAVSDDDAQAYADLRKRLLRMARALHPFLGHMPPRLGGGRKDRLTLARLGLSLRLLGRSDMRDFLRIVNMNAADLLDDNLSGDLLKGALAFDAVLGSNFGARSPGSVLTWLYRLAGEAKGGRDGLALPAGGMGAVTRALSASARAFGAEITTGARVRRVVVERDHAAGVELESGEVLSARSIASSADPKTSFLDLAGPEHLDTGFLRRVRNIRMNGLAAKMNLALDGLPNFTGLDQETLAGRLVIAPDIGYVERAFDHAKYGEFSIEPVIEITIPTLHDKSLAPDGGHVLSAVVQYAPFNLRGGWSEKRAAFADLVVETIARYATDLPGRIVARQLLTPADIERDFGATGGHWHHGDLAVDQMLMLRPVPGWAQYATPLPGLYLCGAGAHPGGGVTGAPGMNAARCILAAESAG
jgi:phytoene dehydrogenase-like protein